MQFSVIGQWLIDGKSPHTGLPVTETRRIVKLQGGQWERDDWGNRLGDEIYKPLPCLYQVGKDYAIQLGRGQKAVGRTPKVASIERQDVRDMTPAQAVASGFATVLDYLLLAWCPMHDMPARSYADCDLQRTWYMLSELPQEWIGSYGDRWLRYLRERPTERYDCWCISFDGSGK